MFIFIATALAAWGVNVVGHTLFPSQNFVPFCVRSAITLGTDVAIIYTSFRLLVQSGLPQGALGLAFSKKAILDIVWGGMIGAIAVAMIAGMLFVFVPYHFVSGSLGISAASKEVVSYVVGNLLEELIFRGFLFVIFSQLVGWRISALILAIPFGLFHLQGTGISIDGLKMVATTACYSFVFSFSYVFFRSLWAATSVHVMSNTCLHVITGLDGENKALLAPTFDRNWPTNYDPGFTVMILTAVTVAALLYFAVESSDKYNRSRT